MNWLYWLGWMSFGSSFRTIFGMRVIGEENLITEGPVLVASNHQSYLDPPLIGNLYKTEMTYLARKTLFRGFGKWLYARWNAIPVDQDRPDMASLKTIIRKLKEGHRVLIFPEGSRTIDGSIGEAAPGIGLAAQSSVTPVGLLGCGARELHVRPTLSRNVVMEWAHQLRQHDFTEKTSLAVRARELAPSLVKRTTVIVLSDLHDPDAIAALQVLAQRHDCVVLHLEDPAEQGLRGAGLIRGVEAESGRGFVGFAGRRQVDSSGWQAELSRFGIDYLRLRTDEPILGRLTYFLKNRGFASRAAR